MMKYTVKGATGEALAKRMLFLAWQACGGPFGMGVLQDRGPGQTEDQVWKSAYNADDYEGFLSLRGKPGEIHADYVQGRMMKIGFQWGDDWVSCRSTNWTPDYQAFCRKYKDFDALINAAVAGMPGVTVERDMAAV